MDDLLGLLRKLEKTMSQPTESDIAKLDRATRLESIDRLIDMYISITKIRDELIRCEELDTKDVEEAPISETSS